MGAEHLLFEGQPNEGPRIAELRLQVLHSPNGADVREQRLRRTEILLQSALTDCWEQKAQLKWSSSDAQIIHELLISMTLKINSSRMESTQKHWI